MENFLRITVSLMVLFVVLAFTFNYSLLREWYHSKRMLKELEKKAFKKKYGHGDIQKNDNQSDPS